MHVCIIVLLFIAVSVHLLDIVNNVPLDILFLPLEITVLLVILLIVYHAKLIILVRLVIMVILKFQVLVFSVMSITVLPAPPPTSVVSALEPILQIPMDNVSFASHPALPATPTALALAACLPSTFTPLLRVLVSHAQTPSVLAAILLLHLCA